MSAFPTATRLSLLVGSANRDEHVFDRPATYDLARGPDELATDPELGFGRHFCLGASPARLEACRLEELVTHVLADFEIDESHAERVPSVNVRGYARLPTTVVSRQRPPDHHDPGGFDDSAVLRFR